MRTLKKKVMKQRPPKRRVFNTWAAVATSPIYILRSFGSSYDRHNLYGIGTGGTDLLAKRHNLVP